MSKEKNGLSDLDFGELISVDGGSPNDDIVIDNGDEFKDNSFQDEFSGEDKLSEDFDKKTTKKTAKKVDEDADEDEEDGEKKTPSHEDADSKSQLALVFAGFLNERGILSKYDKDVFQKYVEENGDEDALEFLYNSEVESRVEEIKKMYDDDMQEYIELKDYGMDSLTAGKLIQNKSKFETIKEDTLDEEDNLELRKSIIKQDLKNTTKMSEDDIDELIETLVITGKDIAKAKKSLKSVKDFNEQQIKLEKKRIDDEEKARELSSKEAREKFKSVLYETKEIMGQQVNKPTLQKIEKFLTEPVGNDSNGKPIDGISAWFMKDPIKARINLAYAITTGLLDGKLDKIEKKAKSSVLTDLQENLSKKGAMLDGKTTQSIGGEGSVLRAMKDTFGNF